jgi:hypothetical protein
LALNASLMTVILPGQVDDLEPAGRGLGGGQGGSYLRGAHPDAVCGGGGQGVADLVSAE